ncbi:16S rRNA (guanine(527)-N(7))-methyltransferase RsmG [Novosphingobium sp. TH158]|uniref:16S rRNA (guanine(527)-N(7))-methyltransferase RsmG n=1 Tax=Novosphingobium sp. TH158 TaxID=2067455 RepID=UPI000C7CF4EF|nr:16S rRNA (guanine(527)-N(7))-methyltransferase RsmG [Novosphingobium sp. TH158]PLK27207.1 16S rRNA (guanine(527)-N(7))-methyltransferase RsmG [Novosphingobium sp. TH158]
MIADEIQARAYVAALPGVDAAALDRLDRLAALLIEENTRQNLVSAASLAQVWQRHIADSAQLLTYVSRETAGPWLDLGTGAGFPGLAVACLLPETELLMVESRARRIEWLTRAAESLGLENARVLGSRLELVETRTVRTISARAFAPLDRLLDLSARFSTPDTIWLLPKGRSARQELQELTGWDHMFHVEQSLTDADAGIIVGRVAGKTPKSKGKRK